jgi:hypothetical protein
MKTYCILYSAVALIIGGIVTTSFAQSTPSAAAQVTPSVLASGDDTEGWGMRCEILEVKRVSGDALLIKWRIIGAQSDAVRYDWPQGSNDEAYYIDTVRNRKYSVLTAGSFVDRIGALLHAQTIQPNQQRMAWAKFPAPPITTKKISIYIHSFTPFEDITISE